jgi:cation diffusion facilitator CzcD-associated flavoprotein CzcO
MLGVKTLIIDTAKRVGDSWRNRYHHLVLHDAVWYDHLPYLPFPATWPVFTPKDKLASWFEGYAEAMELTVWNETSLQAAKWSDGTKSWTVTVTRQQEDDETSNTTFPVKVSLP